MKTVKKWSKHAPLDVQFSVHEWPNANVLYETLSMRSIRCSVVLIMSCVYKSLLYSPSCNLKANLTLEGDISTPLSFLFFPTGSHISPYSKTFIPVPLSYICLSSPSIKLPPLVGFLSNFTRTDVLKNAPGKLCRVFGLKKGNQLKKPHQSRYWILL